MAEREKIEQEKDVLIAEKDKALDEKDKFVKAGGLPGLEDFTSSQLKSMARAAKNKTP